MIAQTKYPMSEPEREEYWKRVARLVLRPRSMTLQAAQIVIDAAMFGIGCVEGRVREDQQRRIDAGEKL